MAPQHHHFARMMMRRKCGSLVAWHEGAGLCACFSSGTAIHVFHWSVTVHWVICDVPPTMVRAWWTWRLVCQPADTSCWWSCVRTIQTQCLEVRTSASASMVVL